MTANEKNSLTTLKQKASLYKPTIRQFFSQYTGLCIYTLLIYILFCVLGIPTVVRYGYSITQDYHKIESMTLTKTGAIASGTFGSGIFPVSLILVILSSTMLMKEIICYFWYPSVRELERRVDAIEISKRMGSMRQMSSLQKEDMMPIGTDAASLNPIE